MPGLLAGALGTPVQQGQVKESFLGRIQPLQQTLVLLPKDLDLTLKIVDEGNEFLLGQILRITEDSQNDLPSQSGSGFTLGHQSVTCKKNLSNR
jgi:hypothetical protein